MADTTTVAPKEGPGTRFWNWLTETQVWTSVFRHDRPDSDRGGVLVMHSHVYLHLHPVPRVHDRQLQAAPRVQLVDRRDHARAHAAALVHRVPAAVGSARHLGDHGRLEHGARDAVPRPRRPGRAAAAARRRAADPRG